MPTAPSRSSSSTARDPVRSGPASRSTPSPRRTAPPARCHHDAASRVPAVEGEPERLGDARRAASAGEAEPAQPDRQVAGGPARAGRPRRASAAAAGATLGRPAASGSPVIHIRSASAASTGEPAQRLVEPLGQRPGVLEVATGVLVAAAQRRPAPVTRCGQSVASGMPLRSSTCRRPRARRSTGPRRTAAASGPPVCQCRQIGMSRSTVKGSDSSSTPLGGAVAAVLDVEVGEVGVARRGELVEPVRPGVLDVVDEPGPGRVVAAGQRGRRRRRAGCAAPGPRRRCSLGDPASRRRSSRAARSEVAARGRRGSRGWRAPRRSAAGPRAGGDRRPPGRRGPRPGARRAL